MSRNMLNGAQVIVDYLIQEKVPQVFGLCGHGNIQFIDALYERSSEIKTISVHHESVAGFMADVYYRVSGTADRDLHLLRSGLGQSADLARPTPSSIPCRSWRSPATCRPASSTAAPSRRCTGTIRPTSRPPCARCARRCFSRRAARWCRSRCGRRGRP